MIGNIINTLKNHKKHIFIGFVFYIVFMFSLFPFHDLGNFVSTKVSQITQNQVYLKFENLDVTMIPSPGIFLSNVTLQASQLPPLSAEYITISPNLLGLLSFKPGFSAKVENIFDGDVDFQLRGSSAASSGMTKQKILIDAENIQLKKISDFVKVPMNLEGFLSLDSEAEIDPGFSDQPTAHLNLSGNRVNITSAVVPTQFGPLNLPDTKWKDVIAKAHLSNGELEIEKIQLGSSDDELFAQVRGSIKVQLKPQGTQISVVPGSFDLVIQIKTKPSFQSKAGMFLGFLESYKKSDGNYLFRAQGNNFNGPPKMTPLSSF